MPDLLLPCPTRRLNRLNTLIIAMPARTIKSEVAGYNKQLQRQYDKEVTDFQDKYNKKHPHSHIWRHIIYKREIHVLTQNDEEIICKIEIVRFVIAGTNHTFTFYGSLFLPRTHFSVSLLKAWIPAKLPMLSKAVLKRWSAVVTAPAAAIRCSQPITA